VHDCGIVHKNVEGPRPRRDKGAHRREIREIEFGDPDVAAARRLANACRSPLSGGQVSHRDRDARTSRGERSRGLDTYPGATSRDDRGFAAQVDARRYL
jgi:hypothetical protein